MPTEPASLYRFLFVDTSCRELETSLREMRALELVMEASEPSMTHLRLLMDASVGLKQAEGVLSLLPIVTKEPCYPLPRSFP